MGNYLIKLTQRNRNNDNGADNNRSRIQSIGENSNGMLDTSSVDESEHLLSSPIFKLNGHCFDELFEYLALSELNSLAQTCKSMQQMTSEFFIRNYSGAKFNCLRDSIYLIDSDDARKVTIEKCISVPGFMHLITWIAIENNIVAGVKVIRSFYKFDTYNYDMGKFEYFKLHVDEFKSVYKLTLSNVRINKQTVDYIRKILPNIEELTLIACTVYGDLYDILLKYCKKLRCIEISQLDFKNWSKYKWLRQKYENLEHLKLSIKYPDHTDEIYRMEKNSRILRWLERNNEEIGHVGWDVEDKLDKKYRIPELRTFFECNPNLRSFSCGSLTILFNKYALLDSKIKLDTFHVNCNFNHYSCDEKTLWDLLCRLHAQGFNKRLHMTASTNRTFDQMPTMEFFDQLFLFHCDSELPPFSTRLIEYAESHPFYTRWDEGFFKDEEDDEFERTDKTKNEILSEQLINVEQLYLFREFSLDILLFIQRLKNLKIFKLFRFESAEILQLDMLNKARKQLAGAQKVTIYVPDDVFLATKWATKNGTTNFSLIEIKRIHSYEWKRCVYGGMQTYYLPPGIF